ncbi:retrovirus-related pol polyprotein from transposon TNT 1-94 [Tanacetum coccineum]|uniref:Retrovirus-related pol polyprotein from transposon TNT 1-94 n=1 Tax=Tanacetum coccineum TaxID=301880 RepID=A0ABQ4WER7_9ASTR
MNPLLRQDVTLAELLCTQPRIMILLYSLEEGTHLVHGQWMLKEYNWCQELSAQIHGTMRTQASIPDVTHSPIIHQAFSSSNTYLDPLDRWSGEQNIELLNIICKPTEGMLTKSMAAKLIAVSTNKCIFADFLYEVKPKKVSEVLKHPRWVGSMQEELNQFHRNKVWTIIPCPRGKTMIGSKWIFMNKMDKYGTIIGKKERVVAQGYMQEKGIEYDETFALVAILKAIRIFIAYATYMNFKVYQMDFKSAFLNGKLKKKKFVQQPFSFESNEFLEYICKLDKALYGLKQALRACASVKTHMVPLKNLGPDLSRKPVNET